MYFPVYKNALIIVDNSSYPDISSEEEEKLVVLSGIKTDNLFETFPFFVLF